MADRDVLVVGGGPAGAAAGVFLGRADLDALVCDAGRSSLDRCAHLENYLGFPAGIDVPTFRDLSRAHLAESGCECAELHVTSVTRSAADEDDESDASDEPFRVEFEDREATTAARVLAATKHGAEYLRPLDDGDLFSDRDHWLVEADADGRTAVSGVYAAGPLTGTVDQAIVAAGYGATAAVALIEDRLVAERDYPRALASQYWDWVRRASELTDDRDEQIAAWVRETIPDDAHPGEETVSRVVADVLAHDREQFVSESERRDRAERGRERLGELLFD